MLPSRPVTDEAPPPAASAPPGARFSSIVKMAGVFYGVVGLFAFGYAFFDWLQRDGVPQGYVFLGLAFPSFGMTIAGLGIGLAIVGVVHVGRRSIPGVDRAVDELARLIGPISTGDALWLALFSGIGEELLFRGALWSHLGWFGTTFLFGLVHIVPRRRLWSYPLFAAGAGLLLGLLRDTSGSVIPPILAHVTVNGINLVWLARRAARPAALSGGDA